jgi:DNA invertase Pin-like site-specific DNA recombinase
VAKLLGYARVSTLEQNAALQHDALAAAGCWKVFTDHVSGATQARPQLDRALEQCRDGDTLVVWRLDRLGRSLRHLIEVVSDLSERGVGFRSMTEAIDTTLLLNRLHGLGREPTPVGGPFGNTRVREVSAPVWSAVLGGGPTGRDE